MNSLLIAIQRFLGAFFIALLFLTPTRLYAGDGGNAMAQASLVKTMLLTVAGAASVAKGASLIAAKKYPPGIAWLAGGIAELAGAAMAGANNAQTEEQTRTTEGYMPDPNAKAGSAAGSGLSGGLPSGVNIQDICNKAAGVCNCNGSSCSNPKINIPELADLKNTITDNYANNKSDFPDGFSLQEALAKLDNEYGKAQDAVNAFNSLSDKGGFNSNALLASSGEVQDVKDPSDLTSGNDRPTIGSSGKDIAGSGDTDAAKAAAAAAAATKSLALSDKFANKLNKFPLRAMNRHGLHLEDARTGRLLTIFERVSRAIRTDRDRNVTLARIELARKELNKKNALNGNTIAASQTAISLEAK